MSIVDQQQDANATAGLDTSAADHPRLPIADAAASWRHSLRLLRPRRGALLVTTVLLLAGTASGLLIPPALGWMVNAVIAGDGTAHLLRLAAIVVVAGIVSAILLLLGGRMLVACLQDSLAQLREEVFATAVRLEQADLDSVGTSDVVSRVTGDVEAITDAVSEVLPRFVQAGFTIVLTLVGLAALDPWLAAAALCAVPLQYVSTHWFLRRSKPLYRRLRLEESHRGQAIIESIRGADTVVAHARQDHHLNQIARRSLTAVETQREASRARNRFYAGLNTAEFIGLAAILAVGYWQVGAAGLSIGAVTAAALFFHRLFGPIGALLASIDDLQRAAAGLGRLVGVVQARPESVPRQQSQDGTITVRDLTFRYRADAAPAVDHINLSVAAGETILLVGVSGSGKSTLVQMISGALIPQAGAVTIGGAAAPQAWWGAQRAVLLVTQETHVFTGSLADNLRLADPAATDEALWAALDAVEAGWTREFSEGLGAALGHDLDEAKIQQVALARVLLTDPPVVVLDEATAHGGSGGSLDAAVRAVTAGRTAVIVAHRFSQGSTADRIVVLDRGRISEEGTEADLLRRPGSTYAALYAAAHGIHGDADEAGSR